MTERPLVAVLAGGRSARMGSDKAHVPVGARPMASWVIEVALSIGDTVVIGRMDPLFGVPAIPDDPPGGKGPAAGLSAALALAGGRDVVLLAVDQPWLRPATLRHLLDRSEAARPVIPFHRGIPQVTCAVYPAALAGVVREAAEAERSIRSVLDHGYDAVDPETWRPWGEDGRSWYSVDTPESLIAGLALFGPPGT